MISLDNILRTFIDVIKENGFNYKKKEADDIPLKL